MNRSDLIQRISDQNHDLPPVVVEAAVKIIIDHMTQTLVTGGRIEIRGFGSFTTHAYEAREVRNPKTGEKLIKAARRLPHFKPGKPLRDAVNGD